MKIFLVIGLVLSCISIPIKANEPCDNGTLDAPKSAKKALTTASIILVGELHGTVQSPEIFIQLVCMLGRKNKKVLVALEIPRDTSLRAMASAKSDVPFKTIENTRKFWTRTGNQSDGRNSLAMQKMVKTLLAIEETKHFNISLAPVDVPYYDGVLYADRDFEIAEQLVTYMETSDFDYILMYVGSLHIYKSRKEGLYRGIPSFLAAYKTYSIAIHPISGSFWACTGKTGPTKCGANPLPKNNDLTGGIYNSVFPLPANTMLPVDAIIQLKTISASAPVGSLH
jgi:hypothetical protein